MKHASLSLVSELQRNKIVAYSPFSCSVNLEIEFKHRLFFQPVRLAASLASLEPAWNAGLSGTALFDGLPVPAALQI